MTAQENERESSATGGCACKYAQRDNAKPTLFKLEKGEGVGMSCRMMNDSHALAVQQIAGCAAAR